LAISKPALQEVDGTVLRPLTVNGVKDMPVVNFINVNRANFTSESIFSSYVLALNKLSNKYGARKMLMKLTPG
jgi:hypothetical protein